MVQIYKDDGTTTQSIEATPVSILSIARKKEARKENTIKPGTWTTALPQRKQAVHRAPAFKGFHYWNF